MNTGSARHSNGSPGNATAAELRGDTTTAEELARYRWAAGLVEGKRVLDVGCGTGRGSTILLDGGAREVIGVDSAAAVIEVARSQERPGLRFAHAPGHALDHPDTSFDVVVCVRAADRCGEINAMFAELARVLVPQGLAAVSARMSDSELEDALRGFWPHIRMLDQRTWIGSAIVERSETPSGTGDPLPAFPVEGAHDDRAMTGRTAVALAGRSEPPLSTAFVTLTGTARATDWLAHSEEQRRTIDDQNKLIVRLEGMQRERSQLRQQLIEAEAQLEQAVRLKVEVACLRMECDRLLTREKTLEKTLETLLQSPSWRITHPLRLAKRWLKSHVG